jgi:hypothetical protein
MKVPSFAFRPEAKDDDERADYDSFEKYQRPRVTQAFLHSLVDGNRRGSKPNSQLVHEPRKQATHCVGREFVQMSGNYSKAAVHSGLHQTMRRR